MRVGSEATEALQSSGVKNLQTGRALVSISGPKTPLIREVPDYCTSKWRCNGHCHGNADTETQVE